jgi:hypothetical protein
MRPSGSSLPIGAASQSSSRLAWSTFALSSVLLLAALVLEWFTRNVSGSNGFGESGPGFILCHELQFAVNGTVQPTPASIWLCPGAGATVGAAGG